MSKRESKYELMRIVSMVFIVLWHIIGHGKILENCQNPLINNIFGLLKYIIIVHVNSFVILLGYFQCNSKFKLSKVILLVFQTIFYSVGLLFILYSIGMVKDIYFSNIMNVLFPFSNVDYWFISSYLITYILSDYINIFIEKLNHIQYKKLIILCFVIFSIIPFITGMRFVHNDGFNFFHFIFLYMLGAYLRKYPLKDNYIFKKFSVNGYRLLLIFIFFLCATYNFFLINFATNNLYNGQILSHISNVLLYSSGSYSSPIVIIQTVCYFEFFKTLNIKSKLINFLSGFVFGIYLFHENAYIKPFLYKLLRIDTGIYYGRKILIKVPIALLIIIVVGFLIELFRKILCKLLHKTNIYKKVSGMFYNYINSFNEKKGEIK